MELVINAVWKRLARLFDGALPGPGAASLWVLVQFVGPKVSRVIIKWKKQIYNEEHCIRPAMLDTQNCLDNTSKMLKQPNFFHSQLPTWRSGYCYLNKRECGLNRSRVDSFVGRVAKNNS